MRVDAHVAGRPCQALVFPVGNVLVGFRIYILLGQPKVNDVDDIVLLGGLPPDEEVFGFHVPVDQMFCVHILNSMKLKQQEQHHLVGTSFCLEIRGSLLRHS